jgi:hypothetical protein
MKSKLLFAGVLLSGFSFTGFSQTNFKAVGTATLEVNKTFNHSVMDYQNQPKTVQCIDTLHYPLVKQQLLGPNGSAGFSTFALWQSDAESVSQMFYGYSGTQVNGVQILGFRHTSSVATVVVRASIYNVDGTNTPTGAALGSGTVTITSTTQNLYSINFSAPISVTGNYAVVLDVTNAGGIYTSFYNSAAAGQVIDENLARFKSNDATLGSNGNWIPMTSITGLGQTVDFEPVVAPLVSYQINTTGTVTPTTACLGEAVTFANTTTTPQLADRMYNYQKFRQHFAFTTNDSTYVWDIDSDANPATTPNGDLIWSGNTTHTYTAAGTFAPDIISLGGFWNTCLDFQSHSVTINAVDNAAFGYSSSTICEGSAPVTPTITGTAGGTFTGTAGLSINASTGEIDVVNSTTAAHVVTYTTAGVCPASSTQNLTITGAPDASFTYAATDYCTSGTNPSPVLTGTAGVFSSTAGLSINASTGAIVLATSAPGMYTVTNTIAASGSCAEASETFDIIITEASDAAFTYVTSSYCLNGTDPTPTITGTSGVFSSTTGLALNASTGEIDLAGSTAGSYTVTNTVAASGACPAATSTFAVTVANNPNASFSYAETDYCATGTAAAVVTGTSGVFSSTTGLSVNASTGALNLASSAAGTYTVTNTIAATAGCAAATATTTVTVESTPTAATTVSGATITATEATGVTYQWINCAGNTPISGETSQSYTATANGSYAVIVTNGDCATTSACQVVSGLGIESNGMELVSIFPSPADQSITISGLTADKTTVSIVDVNGKLLWSEVVSSSQAELSVANFGAGVYFINITSDKITGTKRFIKK